ncbi:hypothetical protein VNO78_19131 [Psophocarpus tetragonolobus]|uniref:Senescence domain-containing protein n=1 Tax=Psophocarpus tetragonolobus TaxID=3891 RepID=A0AAN9S7W9_PSOTE
MTKSVANGVLTGVVKVSGFFTSSVANSKAGKKFFNLLPGEVVLASLDGFGRVYDALEVAGKSVMSTSNTDKRSCQLQCASVSRPANSHSKSQVLLGLSKQLQQLVPNFNKVKSGEVLTEGLATNSTTHLGS